MSSPVIRGKKTFVENFKRGFSYTKSQSVFCRENPPVYEILPFTNVDDALEFILGPISCRPHYGNFILRPSATTEDAISLNVPNSRLYTIYEGWFIIKLKGVTVVPYVEGVKLIKEKELNERFGGLILNADK